MTVLLPSAAYWIVHVVLAESVEVFYAVPKTKQVNFLVKIHAHGRQFDAELGCQEAHSRRQVQDVIPVKESNDPYDVAFELGEPDECAVR